MILKLRKGTSLFDKGVRGEIIVDDDKSTVVVMDGVTPGGHSLAKENHNLGNHSDVFINYDENNCQGPAPVNGDVLTYDNISQKWVSRKPSTDNLAVLNSANMFYATQTVQPIAIQSVVSGSTEINASLSNNWRIYVGGDIFVAPPTGLIDGTILNLLFIHPAAENNQVYNVLFHQMFDFGIQPPPSFDVGPSYHFASCYYDASLDILISTWRKGAAGVGV